MEKEKKPKIKKVTRLRKVHIADEEGGQDGHHDMEAGLRAIYGEEPQDLHVVERGGSRLTFWLWRVLGVLAILALLSLSAVFLVSKGVFLGSKYDPLEIEVVAPAEAKSGEMVTIEIPYQNPKSIPLASLELDVNLPQSFKLLSSTPAPTNTED